MQPQARTTPPEIRHCRSEIHGFFDFKGKVGGRFRHEFVRGVFGIRGENCGVNVIGRDGLRRVERAVPRVQAFVE